jgi:hypothetical protein
VGCDISTMTVRFDAISLSLLINRELIKSAFLLHRLQSNKSSLVTIMLGNVNL